MYQILLLLHEIRDTLLMVTCKLRRAEREILETMQY